MISSVLLHRDLSLDETWDHQEGVDSPSAKVPLVERVPDERSQEPYLDADERSDGYRVIRTALMEMSPREAEICLRRILDFEEDSIQDDFAVEWGVSRQRVQQIEAKACEKLRRAWGVVHGRKSPHGHPPTDPGSSPSPRS